MPAAPRVLGLSGFGLTVPDLDVARRFYATFGLDCTQSGQTVCLRSPGRIHDEITICPGREKRLCHLSFFIDPGTQEAFADRLAKEGIAVRDRPPWPDAAPGPWFQEPWGMWIHLNPMRPEASRDCPMPPENTGTSERRVNIHLWQEIDRRRAPLRIGHMLMFTQDWEKVERFYCNVLGFRTSDRANGKVAFMAAGDGVVDHHCFGLINGTHRGLQHASFHVGGIDDIGFTAWRMREAGYRDSFGPGRHAVASNLFHYTRDPWGSWIECYADMDKVDERWQTREWKSLPYIWGPDWSPEFWANDHNANLEPR